MTNHNFNALNRLLRGTCQCYAKSKQKEVAWLMMRLHCDLYHVINGQPRIFMLEIQRLNVECIVQTSAVFHPENTAFKNSWSLRKVILLPHGRAVKMYHQPLGGVECNAVCIFDAFKKIPKFRADKGRPCVGRIHVKPHLLFFAFCEQKTKEHPSNLHIN